MIVRAGPSSGKKSFSTSVFHTWGGLHPPRHRRASLESGVAICSEGPPRPLTCETPFHKIWPILDYFYSCFCSNRSFWTYHFRQGIFLWERFSPFKRYLEGELRDGEDLPNCYDQVRQKTHAVGPTKTSDQGIPPPLYKVFNEEAFTKLEGPAPLYRQNPQRGFWRAPFPQQHRIWRFHVRHGESEWNQQNRFCGWFDANLSETGIKVVTKAIRMMMVVMVVIRDPRNQILLRLSE